LIAQLRPSSTPSLQLFIIERQSAYAARLRAPAMNGDRHRRI
jgi:hypothetical protein